MAKAAAKPARLLLCCGLWLWFAAAVPPAAAADHGARPIAAVPPPVIVVVDMQSTLQQSMAAQSISSQLDARREEYKAEIAVLEDKLRATDQELAQVAEGADKTQFEGRRRTFEVGVGAVQRLAQSRKRTLDDAFNTASNMVVSRLRDVVAEISHQHGANIVLNRQQVVIASDAMDITSQVLGRLNEVLPTVTVAVHPEANSDDAAIIDAIRKR